MQIQPEISFRNFEPTDALRLRVLEEVGRLEHFFDGIVTCRIVMEIPHRRRRSGNLYHVRIDVSVPGDELVVSRDPAADRSRADPVVALEDAFAAMQRQLEDYARKLRGQVKSHATTTPDSGSASG